MSWNSQKFKYRKQIGPKWHIKWKFLKIKWIHIFFAEMNSNILVMISIWIFFLKAKLKSLLTENIHSTKWEISTTTSTPYFGPLFLLKVILTFHPSLKFITISAYTNPSPKLSKFITISAYTNPSPKLSICWIRLREICIFGKFYIDCETLKA